MISVSCRMSKSIPSGNFKRWVKPDDIGMIPVCVFVYEVAVQLFSNKTDTVAVRVRTKRDKLHITPGFPYPSRSSLPVSGSTLNRTNLSSSCSATYMFIGIGFLFPLQIRLLWSVRPGQRRRVPPEPASSRSISIRRWIHWLAMEKPLK